MNCGRSIRHLNVFGYRLLFSSSSFRIGSSPPRCALFLIPAKSFCSYGRTLTGNYTSSAILHLNISLGGFILLILFRSVKEGRYLIYFYDEGTNMFAAVDRIHDTVTRLF